ncbi:hypothetical protein L6452_13537 [Arctium lappa]|uniref:Uncharacterized protein n=1 Tax=Arctium lappa TaxID=4217 RepID=A0ACB9CIH1_ARCLA|nr:hypothetical protein L6452_13537 [Arctium lappa]
MISSGNTRGTKRKEQETTMCDAKASKTREPTMDRNPKAKTSGTSGVQIITRSTQRTAQTSAVKIAKGKGEHKMLPTDVQIKLKGKQQAIPDYNSDSDFEEHHMILSDI